jgi:hypothetical protein
MGAAIKEIERLRAGLAEISRIRGATEKGDVKKRADMMQAVARGLIGEGLQV